MEMAQGMSQGQDTPAPSGNVQPVNSQVQAEERSFKQSDVDSIVKKAKHDAVESYRRQQTEQPEYAAQKYRESQPAYDQRGDQGQRLPEHEIRRLAAEEAQRLRDDWVRDAQSKAESDQAQRIVQNFWNKISPGKEKYQDFDAVTGDIEFTRFPNVVHLLADHIDNSHDVLYELGKDRFKIGQLEQLAMMSPRDAIIQAQRLSASIKANEDASKMRVPNEPLSQMRPSNNGTSTGPMSVKDFRAKYRV